METISGSNWLDVLITALIVLGSIATVVIPVQLANRRAIKAAHEEVKTVHAEVKTNHGLTAAAYLEKIADIQVDTSITRAQMSEVLERLARHEIDDAKRFAEIAETIKAQHPATQS